MSTLRSRRGVLLLVVAVMLGLFLFRPGAARLKYRIAASVGGALQRQVEIGSVHIRLLPRPGFDLEDFIVYDDPTFSAEPVLRAQEVTAALRLIPLLRGHLEVSRLSLTEPSLNLVRNTDGHWNLESLLEHARQTPIAPTGAPRTVGRPAFPYIEADRGRINFKLGSEKTPFALTDADYALWQDSDRSWGMRLKAQPLRTDVNLSDTGLLRMSGTWQRADSLRNTPIQFNLAWEKAQLGQVTKLFSGQDRGWRATVRLNASLSGTPGDLLVDTQGALEDFRRYDIVAETPMAMRTHCTAHYSSIDRGFHEVNCVSPIGEGSLTVTGSIARVLAPPRYALALRAEKVPMPAVLALARHTKLDLPRDLQAAGTLSASVEASAEGEGSARSVVFRGTGATDDFRLTSASNKTDLLLDNVPLVLVSSGQRTGRTTRHPSALAESEPESAHLMVGPFRLDHASPLTAQGYVSRQGYLFAVTGDGNVQRILQSARTLGLPVGQPMADGAAKLDLQISGNWAGFAAPRIAGSAQLKNLRIELRGLTSPLEVASAAVTLKPERVDVKNIAATAAGSRWTGSLSFPRPCTALQTCPITFNLQADQISSERIAKFASASSNEPWYRFLAPDKNSGSGFFARLNASGWLAANQFTVHAFTTTHVAANLAVQGAILRISDLRGEALSGKHRGQWEVNFNVRPPRYTGEGTLEHASLDSLASAMHSDWISGAGSARYQVTSSGFTVSELIDAASGTLHLEMSDGELKRVVVDNSPLRVRRFDGEIALRSGEFAIEDASLETPTASYNVSGTATWARELNIKLVRDKNSGLDVTGTLEEPRVMVVHPPATEAALKH